LFSSRLAGAPQFEKENLAVMMMMMLKEKTLIRFSLVVFVEDNDTSDVRHRHYISAPECISIEHQFKILSTVCGACLKRDRNL
jgi:hypothetical protein